MQRTLILLKPDCVLNGHCGEVIGRFEKAGLQIKACKMIQLQESILREHYAHVADKPFFPEIVAFMQSAPVIALVLEAENAIGLVRDMLGPTDSSQAAKGTIRGDLGKDKMMNMVHASDSEENAAMEVARFFEPGEVIHE